MSNVPKHRQLPPKEAGLFKTLLTQYEMRQFKKGVKAADGILKKFPNHGETLAIKALTIHASLPTPATVASLPKEEEAEAMARLAVKKDITSHITWHVLGLIAKGKKDWAEASKAFGQARKIDPDNIPLLRDYISLSLHTRNYAQALAARHHFVCIRPNIRQNWIGLMLNHQLNGDIDEAIKVVEGLASVSQSDGLGPSERSQLTLHKIQLYKAANRHAEALATLEAGLASKTIPARGEILSLRASLLSDLGRKEEAEDCYRKLLEQNPDSLANYRGFLANKGLSLDGTEAEKVLKTLAGFTESYPRSAAPKRMALDVASGEMFRVLATTYIVAGLERGVPSLFVDIKSLYENGDKMAVVGEIVEDVVTKLEAETSLHGDDTLPPPTTLLWAYYFLALHLAHPRHPSPDHVRALELLDKAIKHTPTLPELYMARAMVLKRAGDATSAAREMELARALDGQDRYVNGKAGKYLMRAGQGDKAIEIMGLFTKKDAVSPAQDLTDLQCLWFLQEQGDMHLRAGNFGMALKRYHTTVQVFQDYEDDQWDFHSYCLRKMTLAAYIDLMRYEDQLRSHPGFFKAVLSALAIYIKIHDDPSLLEEKITPEEEAERKKAAKKAQKAEQKAKKAALSSGEGSKAGEQPAPDPDPTGQTLLRTETPLDDAIKLWKQLERMASSRVEVWIAAYELFIRKQQYLLALKALTHAAAIDSQVPDLHRQIIHFKKTTTHAELSPAVAKTISEVLPTILPNEQSTAAFNSAFTQTHSSSPAHIFAAARGLAEELTEPGQKTQSLSTEAKEQVAALLDQLLDPSVRPDVAVFMRAEVFLRDGLGLDVTKFRAGVHARLPLAWGFATTDEVLKRAKAWEEEENKDKEADGIN